MTRSIPLTVAALLLTIAGPVVLLAQTSSLYVEGDALSLQQIATSGVADRLSPQVSRMSLTAVRPPQPRQFSTHDLITIIVRESIENESESELETEKDFSLNGVISAFPDLRLKDLADFQLGQSTLNDGNPEVNITLNRSFEGEGEYERKDTFTTRITARVIDIKPNGSLVLEARKFIQSDKESVNIIMTGTCRKEDVTPDNTILSTQIYDLRLEKQHDGELRKAVRKGLLTKLFEFIFSF